MYEKILEKLKQQRGQNTQVSDRTLESMAKRYARYIDTDEKLESEDFKEDIENIQGNIGAIAKQVKEDTEKKITPEKKPEEKKEKVEKPDEKKEDMPEWAKSMLEQNKVLLEKVNGMQDEKVTQSRSEILNEKLKETPLIFKNATISGFNRMKFENDEEFNAYLSEVEENAKAAIQEGNEKGLNTSTPKPDVHKPDPEEVSPEMQKAIEGITKKEEKKGKF